MNAGNAGKLLIHKHNVIVLMAIGIFFIIAIESILGIKPAIKCVSQDTITLPKGFKIDFFTETLDGTVQHLSGSYR